MQLKSRPTLVAILVAAGAATAGCLVAVSRAPNHWAGPYGIRLVAFLVGGLAFGTAIYFFQRGIRRRARLNAIADLLPRYRRDRARDEFVFDEADLDGDLSGGVPVARAEIRAATRALMVSLEDELRRETGRTRRAGRPACRRARLRAVGRTEPRRRRVVTRLATVTS